MVHNINLLQVYLQSKARNDDNGNVVYTIFIISDNL